MKPMPTRLTPTQLTLAAIVLLGFIARAIGAFDDGIFWPDEIYQSFEPAHSLVFGNGLIPWEFIDGARNWSIPGLVAALLKVCSFIGLDSPPGYIRFVKLVFAAISMVTALGVYRLARAFEAPDWAAIASVALFSFAAPIIYFAPRAMSENACAAPLVWGVALLFEKTDAFKRNQVLLGASLLGLAVLFRLQCAVVVTGVVIALAVQKQWKTLGFSLGTLAVWALLYGGLDAATWNHAPKVLYGGWFHSAVVYLRFNLIEGRAAQWGTSPWWFYFAALARSMPSVTVALALGLVGALARRSWVLPWLLACFFALHIASPHKEFRFIISGLPLACACVGVALRFDADKRVLNFSAIVVLLALVSAFHTSALTMGELGAYLDRPLSSAWSDFGNVNRLLLKASQRPDLCGLRVDGVDMAWAGGFTYLHKNVPLYRPNHPHQTEHFNYVIGPTGYAGVEVIAEDHGLQLYRLPISVCQKDPGYAWRL